MGGDAHLYPMYRYWHLGRWLPAKADGRARGTTHRPF